jgi:hypothetical protein
MQLENRVSTLLIASLRIVDLGPVWFRVLGNLRLSVFTVADERVTEKSKIKRSPFGWDFAFLD